MEKIKQLFCVHKYEYDFNNLAREKPIWAKIEIAKCKKCNKKKYI